MVYDQQINSKGQKNLIWSGHPGPGMGKVVERQARLERGRSSSEWGRLDGEDVHRYEHSDLTTVSRNETNLRYDHLGACDDGSECSGRRWCSWR